MTDFTNQIYLGTVLLEKNRWAWPRAATFAVSPWISRMADAGFDGIELWEYHATMAPAEEVDALAASPLPLPIFNSYVACDDDGEADRRRVTEMAARLGATRIKFNVGREADQRDAYIANVRNWLNTLPDEMTLLCECHPGTLMETPEAAAEFFRAWDTERIRAIIHPFTQDADAVRAWFRHLGPIITHAHVQISGDDDKRVRLSRKAEVVQEILHAMRAEGFQGSYTVEFTEGVAMPDENMDSLFNNAVNDLRFLREHLS